MRNRIYLNLHFLQLCMTSTRNLCSTILFICVIASWCAPVFACCRWSSMNPINKFLYCIVISRTWFLSFDSFLICNTVCHHWWARNPAACYWAVEENTFKGATGSTGEIALKKLDLQSWEWEGVWGINFLAVISITYSKMGWQAAGGLPSPFCGGL